jgi:hypothetical protein
MKNSSQPDANQNSGEPTGDSPKRKVQPLIELTESQLLTPDQLNLPTLSVLETDLASKLDNYRPKEIIHKDTPARELVGNALPPKRAANDGWEIARALLDGFVDLPLRNIQTLKATDQAWWLEATVTKTKQPVSLLIPKRTFSKKNVPSWAELQQRIQAMDTDCLPKIVHSGLLIGDYPLIVTEKIDGPFLLDCHAGIHLPNVVIDWNKGHGRGLIELLSHVAKALCQLHNAFAWMGPLNWKSIQISAADGHAKLMQWDMVSWLFESPTEESSEIHQQKDRELFGRLLYLMAYSNKWNDTNWRSVLEMPLAEIASMAQAQSSVPRDLGEIVAKCIKAPKSQHYTQTQLLVNDLKQFLDSSRPSQELSSTPVQTSRSNKSTWRGLFKR